MEDCKSISECPAVDELVEFSKTLDNGESARESYHLKWIPYRELTNIRSCQSSVKQTAYYATYTYEAVILLLLGTVEECTQEFIHEFARTYSLPTYKYDSSSNIVQFRRYSTWLERRNKLIE